MTPPEERVDWVPATIKLANNVPWDLQRALKINQGYTYSKFARFKDFYLFSDFTFDSSLGRVAILKGHELIGEIRGEPGKELLGQYLWIG